MLEGSTVQVRASACGSGGDRVARERRGTRDQGVIVKAMVLAAGRGARLGSMTDTGPKPMIAIAGKPILEHTVTWLRDSGISDIVINLHHHADQIRAHFGDGSALGARIAYSFEPSLLGTAGALRPVRQAFASTFLVVYGDNFFSCDLDRFLAAHRRHGGIGTMALYEWPNATQSGVARLDEDSRIVEFVEKPPAGRAPSALINAGLLLWEPEVFRFIPGEGPADFARDVVPRILRNGGRLYGHVMREPELLLWIDTPEDYARAQARARERLGAA